MRVGHAPPVRISVIRTVVSSCRWPRLRREFFRRRFLKAITLGPRPCSTTSAATEAPVTVGVPIVTVSPPTISTSANLIVRPASPSTFSTFNKSLAVTRYCLPPVLMTANIFLSSCSNPGLGRPASFSRLGIGWPLLATINARGPYSPFVPGTYDGQPAICQRCNRGPRLGVRLSFGFRGPLVARPAHWLDDDVCPLANSRPS